MREAGAAEVHLRISSPPTAWPCYYGIDTPRRERADRGAAVARGDPRASSRPTRSPTSRSTGCSRCVGGARTSYCTACWTGDYPVPIAGEDRRQAELFPHEQEADDDAPPVPRRRRGPRRRSRPGAPETVALSRRPRPEFRARSSPRSGAGTAAARRSGTPGIASRRSNDLGDRLDHVVDVALGVDAARDRQPHQLDAAPGAPRRSPGRAPNITRADLDSRGCRRAR